MLKSIARFLIILSIAIALGVGFYYLVQPAGQTSLQSGIGNLRHVSGDIGGEHGFGEGGFSLTRGLFGITGNLIMIAVVTVLVIAVQKIFSRKTGNITTR